MSSKKTIALILFLLLLLLAVSLYLFIKLKASKPVLIPLSNKPDKSTLIVQRPTDPIKKSFVGDGKYVQYEMLGSFEGALEEASPTLGTVKGIFVIKGDTMKRGIVVILGKIDGTLLLGEYQGSFRSDSTWEITPAADLLNLIKPDEEVLLTTMMSVKDNSTNSVLVPEDVLDDLILEFQSSEFKREIPRDFALAVTKVGIVK